MKEKLILGKDINRDKTLLSKVIWFKGKYCSNNHIKRIGVAKIRAIDDNTDSIYIDIIADFSKEEYKKLFNPSEWTLHSGDEIKLINKLDAFFYMI